VRSLGHLASLARAKELGNVLVEDEAVEVGVDNLVSRESVATLLLGLGGLSAEDVIESLDSRLGPDDEATNSSTRSEVEEVKLVDVSKLNAGESANSLADTLVLSNNNERTNSSGVNAVAAASNTGSAAAGSSSTSDVITSTDLLEDLKSLRGLGNLLESILNDEGNLRNIANSMAASHNQSGNSRSSKSRNNCEALLVHVDVTVPAAESASRLEHATLADHVTEGSLTSTASTRTGNTRDTSNSTTSTPGLSRVAGTSLGVDSIGLTRVLAHVGVDLVNDINTQGSTEDGRGGDLSDLSAFNVVNREGRTKSGHDNPIRVWMQMR